MSWLRATGLRILLSVGLAFALWVFVSYTQNPDRDTSYDSVPVDVVGRAPDLLLVDKDGMPRAGLAAVNVTVLADTATLRNVQQSSIRALVDLTGLGPGEHQVPVDVETTRSDLKRVTFQARPSFLPIRLEQEITRTVPLTIEVAGTVPFSFEAGTPRLTIQNQPVENVLVRGPQSRVERVKIVGVQVDIDRLTANYSSPRTPVALGDDSQPVAGVSVVPATVDVLVPIVSSAGIKRVPIVPQLVGQPASGFIVASVSVEPQFVRLTGSSGPLEAVLSITTENIDITGASQAIRRTAELRPPPNIGLAAGEPTTVQVTIQVQPIARPFQVTVPVSVIVVGVPDGLLASLSPQSVQLTLTGTAAQLAGLDPSKLQGTVSVAGRGAGSYALEPSFNLPNGVTVVGDPPRVTVTLREPTPTPEGPTAAPTGEATPTGAPAPTGEPSPTPGGPTAAPSPAPTGEPAPAASPTP